MSAPSFAQNDVFQEIIQDEELFNFARTFAQSLTIAEFEFLFDQILVDARYDYLITGRGGHLALPLLPMTAEPSRNYIGNRLNREAINAIDDQTTEAALANLETFLNQRWACEQNNTCSDVPNNEEIAREVVAEYFPSFLQYIEPDAGDVTPTVPPLSDTPPDTNSIPELAEWLFASQDCVATEAELFDLIQSRFDTWTANIAVINISNQDNVELISRTPFTYQLTQTPPYCP